MQVCPSNDQRGSSALTSPSEERHEIMMDNPVDLVERSDIAAGLNSKHPIKLQASEAALRHLEEELERLFKDVGICIETKPLFTES